MYYEVFIPSADADGYDVTITVEGENWMSALKSGLERVGEGPDAVRNVMCDIKEDNTIHVTDAATQRVFVLEELGEELPDDREAAEPSAVEAEPEPIEEEPPDIPEEAAHEPVEPEAGEDDEEEPLELGEDLQVDEPEAADESAAPEADMEVGSPTQEELKEVETGATVVGEEREPTGTHDTTEIGRDSRASTSVSQNLIEDVFLEIQTIHQGDMSMEEVVNYVIDLAMEKIDAESGSILFADQSGRELYFAAARGPKSDEVMDFRVPMSEGIVGFCSREGVSLAIGDAQEDPRFYEEISESIGYDTDSLLCSPIQYEGRVYGAVELINKERGSAFDSDEMHALSYIGRQLAEAVNRMVMNRESLEEDE